MKTIRDEDRVEVSGRIFVHGGTKDKPGCGRMVRVSRDWDHKNPQATEPPEHPECEKAVYDKVVRGLIVESTGIPIDNLPALESNEYSDNLWEEDV